MKQKKKIILNVLSGKKNSTLFPEVLPAESSSSSKKKASQIKAHSIEDATLFSNETHLEETDSLENDLKNEELEPEEGEIDSSFLNPKNDLLEIKSEEEEIDSSDSDIESSEKWDVLSVQNPLRRYIDEMKKYPLLEPDEEFRLAVKLRDSGDVEAARRLITANLRLVIKIAFEYRSYYSNVMDLIQEGNVGLMKAVSRYDPSKGARLSYYGSWWIRSYILKYLLDNFRLIKIGTTQAQKKLFYHLMREKERLEAQGLLAGPKLLAEKLNVREKDVIEMEKRLGGTGIEMSLDAPIHSVDEGKGLSHLDLIMDPHEAPDDQLAHQELLLMLHEQLPDFEKTLNEKERSILKARLLAEEPKTLQEVADLYGLTRERARQIEVKVIQKLKDFLKDWISSD